MIHPEEQTVPIYELVSSACKTDGAEGAIVYGIRVSGQDGIFVIEDVSVNIEHVKQLIDILSKAQVAPDQLLYIVEDYIADW